jgi:clan AA aspartic protease
MTPRIEITVQGRYRSVQIPAIIDTGFEGELSLPMDVAQWIGAIVAGWGAMRLADGSEKRLPTARCEVELLGKRTTVEAYVTDTFEPLIGTELLDGCQLIVDFDSGAVQISRLQG